MNKIKRLSQIAQWVLTITMVVLPISLILFWINAPTPLWPAATNYGINTQFLPEGIKILHTLSPTEKSLGFVISLLPLSIKLFITYLLFRLFGEYKRFEIFSIQTVKHLRKIGYTLIIGELIIYPIYQALITGAMTYHNPPGHGLISISFLGYNVGLVITGILIIFISWIMAEGSRLQEEQKYTV